MSTLKYLRTRIKSVISTQKITSAMKMVAASKFKRAHNLVDNAKPFVEEVTRLTARTLHISKMNLVPNPKAPPLIILFAADRGLCGGFNSFMFKAFKNRIKGLSDYYCFGIGKRAVQFLNRSHSNNLLKDIPVFEKFDFEDAKTLTDYINDLVRAKKIGQVDVIYTHFKTVLTLLPTVQTLVPLNLNEPQGSEDPIFEPELEVLLPNLLKLYVNTALYSAFLESHASEQAARMTAMDNATKNAKEMVEKLKLTYNRTRQSNITKELIEIISGAQAS